MTNSQIAEQLNYIALLLEYLEGPSFPVRRFAEMAHAVGRFDFPLERFSSHAELDKIRRLFFPKVRNEQLDVLRGLALERGEPADGAYTRKTGLTCRSRHPLVAALEKDAPPETAELIRLPDMGPARAAALHGALGIKTADDLLRDCGRGLIRKIDGFNAELEKKWKLGKWYSSEKSARTEYTPVSWPVAEFIVRYVLEQLQPLTETFTESGSALTPWEQFQREESGGEPGEPDAQFPQRRPWEVEVRPMSNIRYRRPLLERIRQFFIKAQEPDLPPSYAADRFPRGESAPAPSSAPLAAAVETAGPFRRLEEAVRSLDFLVVTHDPGLLFDHIAKLPFLSETNRSPFTLEAVIERNRLVYGEGRKFPGTAVRFFAASPHSAAAASVFHSSSPAHWSELERRAKDAGLFLDQTGLYRGKEEEAVKSEPEFYRALGLPPLPPEVRDGLFEFQLAAPELLIRRPQMRGDLHMHSVYTDGTGTIEEMAEKGMANGLQYIAMTDHSKRVAVANGMNETRILDYWNDIDQINLRLREANVPFTILKGVEVDVLGTAVLDFSDDILARADWVMASLHFEQGQPREQIHRRLTAAMTCPYVSAISHPTGKTWMSDFRMDMDIDFFFDMALKHGKFVEMNSQPRRFDLDWRLCRMAKERGVKVVISTDSHSPGEMDYMQYGVQLARKAGLTADDIVNTRPVEEILALRKR